MVAFPLVALLFDEEGMMAPPSKGRGDDELLTPPFCTSQSEMLHARQRRKDCRGNIL